MEETRGSSSQGIIISSWLILELSIKNSVVTRLRLKVKDKGFEMNCLNLNKLSAKAGSDAKGTLSTYIVDQMSVYRAIKK